MYGRNSEKKRLLDGSSTGNKEKPTEYLTEFSDLPDEIVMDILSLLPVTDLQSCRYVSTRWLSLISGFEFSRLIHKSKVGLLTVTKDEFKSTYMLRLATLEVAADGSSFLFQKKKLQPHVHIPKVKIQQISTCNGLICMVKKAPVRPTISVCNPVLGQYIIVPIPKDVGNSDKSLFGFGFSNVSKQFKIIKGFHGPYDEDLMMTRVYTLGTNEWRNVPHVPSHVVHMPYNSLYHGALHWIEKDPVDANSRYQMTYFDIETEDIGSILPPTDFNLDEESQMGVYKDCLCLSYRKADHLDIWVMKDYKRRNSWTKVLVIDNLLERKNWWKNFFEPIIVSKNRDIMMVYGDQGIVLYRFEKKRFRLTREIVSCSCPIGSVAFTPSFISLRNIPHNLPVHTTRMRNPRSTRGGRRCN